MAGFPVASTLQKVKNLTLRPPHNSQRKFAQRHAPIPARSRKQGPTKIRSSLAALVHALFESTSLRLNLRVWQLSESSWVWGVRSAGRRLSQGKSYGNLRHCDREIPIFLELSDHIRCLEYTLYRTVVVREGSRGKRFIRHATA